MPTTTTTRPTLPHDERGIALAIAIFAMVIIATLVAGVFFMARLEQRSGSNALWATQAMEAAEAGLGAVLANWSSGVNSMPAGTSQTLATQYLGGHTRYTPTVQKISEQIFLVRSRGERLGGGGILASANVGRIVRLVPPELSINAAVTANGPVTLQGNLTVDGRNTNPPGWTSCGASGDVVAAVETSQSIKAQGSYTAIGNPPPEGLVASSSGVTAATFLDPYNALSPLADVVHLGAWSPSASPRPLATGGVCDTDTRNWGEPRRSGTYVSECVGYSPIVWIRNAGSESRISGGRGQGILLVEGDLDMSGGFEFTGIIIVLGDTKTTGQGAKITGALLAANQAIGDVTYIGGTPVVTYSSCAVAQALLGTARARPLGERSWVQLY